jgi:hypothetical protein
MTPKQIKKLARDTIKAGPVIVHDPDGNGYLGYVILVREGYKYCLVETDKEIVEINGTGLNEQTKFLECEIRAILDNLKLSQLSSTFIDDLPNAGIAG